MEVAGNDDILITGVAPAGWRWSGATAPMEYGLPLAADPSLIRVALRVPVRELIPLLGRLELEGKCRIDHVYDY